MATEEIRISFSACIGHTTAILNNALDVRLLTDTKMGS